MLILLGLRENKPSSPPVMESEGSIDLEAKEDHFVPKTLVSLA